MQEILNIIYNMQEILNIRICLSNLGRLFKLCTNIPKIRNTGKRGPIQKIRHRLLYFLNTSIF